MALDAVISHSSQQESPTHETVKEYKPFRGVDSHRSASYETDAIIPIVYHPSKISTQSNGKFSVHINHTQHAVLLSSIHCLVGRFQGKRPSLEWFKEEIVKTWGLPVMVVQLPTGFFQFVFNSKEEKERIYILGTRRFDIYTLKLFRWVASFDPVKGDPTTISTWITFPNLPLLLWHRDIILAMASLLGTPLAMDNCTANQTKKISAKVLVDIDLKVPRPLAIKLDTYVGTITQEVEYENVPPLCTFCHRIGHVEEDCRTKAMQ